MHAFIALVHNVEIETFSNTKLPPNAAMQHSKQKRSHFFLVDEQSNTAQLTYTDTICLQ
jgi:hypothetical protein